MNLVFVNQSKVSLPRHFVSSWIRAVVLGLPARDRRRLAGLEITVVFLGQRAARRLNREFRNRDYATDVLSFPGGKMSEGGPGAGESLGELVICPEVIKRQSIEHDLSFKLELGYMLLHGVLHLLGYDHEGSKADAVRMFKVQDALFARLRRRKW